MRRQTLLLLVVLVQTGCTAHSVRRHTIAQTETWMDIQYRQVMENLAMVANDPDVLPCYSVQDAGTAGVTDKVGITGVLGIVPNGAAGTGSIDPNATRTISQNWTLTQVTGPEKLRALHLAFKFAVSNDTGILVIHDHNVTLAAFCYPTQGPGCCPMPPPCVASPSPKTSLCDHRAGDPGYYFGVSDDLYAITPGWLHRGTKGDVPKCARFSASCCNTYVWVAEQDMEGLSKFSLVIQRIARQVVDLAYFPVPDIVAINLVGPEQMPNPHGLIPLVHNCERNDNNWLVNQISVPMNCYGNVVIQKRRGDTISPTDPKLKSAIGAAVKSP